VVGAWDDHRLHAGDPLERVICVPATTSRTCTIGEPYERRPLPFVASRAYDDGAMQDGASGLTTPWLATRMGLQSAQIHALRRAGDLVAFRRDDGEYVFPAWQFGRDGRPLPAIRSLVTAARARGIEDERLAHLLGMRAGLTGNGRLADALREGREEEVLRAIGATG